MAKKKQRPLSSKALGVLMQMGGDYELIGSYGNSKHTGSHRLAHRDPGHFDTGNWAVDNRVAYGLRERNLITIDKRRTRIHFNSFVYRLTAEGREIVNAKKVNDALFKAVRSRRRQVPAKIEKAAIKAVNDFTSMMMGRRRR